MFTRKTILGEEQVFGNGLIVATVTDVNDKNVRLNFGYEYDAIISKEEFDFDIKKDDLVNINVKNLTSLTGPVVSFSDVKDYVSITLKGEYNKNNKRRGWCYYFEIVEPKGIVLRKEVLFLIDLAFTEFPLTSTYIEGLKKISKEGIEIINEYKSREFIPNSELKTVRNLPQERVFIDNISIFMYSKKTEESDNNEQQDIKEGMNFSRNRPSVCELMSSSRNQSTINDAKIGTFEDERKKICDISDCDLENIEEFLKIAKSKEDTEMVLIKCRGVIESILKEIIKIDNRIDYDRYNRKTPGEILNDDYIRRMFSENIIHSMINIIKLGNDAAHTNSESSIDCKKVIEDTEEVFSWFKINYKKL